MIYKYWFLGILFMFCIGCSQEKEQHSNDFSYIEVVGFSEKEVDPDIFHLTFSLGETNSSSKNDIQVLEQKMLDTLKSLDINPDTELKIIGLSGDNWYWWRRSRTVYQSKTYELKVNNLELINQVCDKLDNMGSIHYYLSKTDYTKIDELKKEIQQEAVKNAHAKAENLVSVENKKLGELIYLQEQNSQPVKIMYGYENQAEYSSPSIQASSAVNYKKMKVTYQIIARFNINNNKQ